MAFLTTLRPKLLAHTIKRNAGDRERERERERTMNHAYYQCFSPRNDFNGRPYPKMFIRSFLSHCHSLRSTMSSSRTLFVDTSILPSDIFGYRDEEFYFLVDQLAGAEEAELLRIQSIRTVNSFLRITDIFYVLSIDSGEINKVKRQICFLLNNNTYVIKPGIRGSIEYLRDLFLKKTKELSKPGNDRITNSNKRSTTMSSTNDAISQESVASATLVIPIDERLFIVSAVDEWCSRNGRDLDLPDLKLIDGTDYLFALSPSDSEFAQIRCGCRASARLPRQGSHFQLSNFYRHLKTGRCSMLKSKFQSVPASDATIYNDDALQTSLQSTTTESTQPSTSDDADPSVRSKRAPSSPNREHSKKRRRRR
jgi:hypothetical protein